MEIQKNASFTNEMLKKPIRISDLASMARKKIDPNGKPYETACIKANNRLVDEWENVVLKKICDKTASIPAGRAWNEWELFFEGKEIPLFMNAFNAGVIVRSPPTVIDYWLRTFEDSTIEELWKLGNFVVKAGWTTVIMEFKIRSNLEKWEKVFSKSTDPLEWRKLSNDYPKLWNEKRDIMGDWDEQKFMNIAQKVNTVAGVIVEPSR